MPQDLDPKTKADLAFTIRYALRLGKEKVRDMQKDLDEKKLDAVVNSIIDQVLLSNWRIERGPPTPSHSSHGGAGRQEEP